MSRSLKNKLYSADELSLPMTGPLACSFSISKITGNDELRAYIPEKVEGESTYKDILKFLASDLSVINYEFYDDSEDGTPAKHCIREYRGFTVSRLLSLNTGKYCLVFRKPTQAYLDALKNKEDTLLYLTAITEAYESI